MLLGYNLNYIVLNVLKLIYNKMLLKNIFWHERQCKRKKLFYLNIGANESNTFMEDIFGIQIGQSKRAGLVDCMSEDAFDQMLDSLKD